MSILTVENMSHVFGGRVIYEDVSFKLNKTTTNKQTLLEVNYI